THRLIEAALPKVRESKVAEDDGLGLRAVAELVSGRFQDRLSEFRLAEEEVARSGESPRLCWGEQVERRVGLADPLNPGVSVPERPFAVALTAEHRVGLRCVQQRESRKHVAAPRYHLGCAHGELEPGLRSSFAVERHEALP